MLLHLGCIIYCFSDIDLDKETCTNAQYGGHYQHFFKCNSCSSHWKVCCLVCANVCHAGHDVSYYKYTKNSCDCRFIMNTSCQAKKQRFPISEKINSEPKLITTTPLILTQGK